MVHEVTTTDSGDILVSGASTTLRTLTTRFSDVYNVKDFGCTGDGTTDDTVNFQAAVDTAITDGVPVYIPKGTYIVDHLSLNYRDANDAAILISLSSGSFVMFGDGERSIIKRINNPTAGELGDNQQIIGVIVTGNVDKIEFSDFHIDGNFANNPITNPAGDTFEFEHCPNVVFWAGPSSSALIKRVHCSNITHTDPVADCFWLPNSEGDSSSYGIEAAVFDNITVLGRTATRSDITLSGATALSVYINNFTGFRIEAEISTEFTGKRYLFCNNCKCEGTPSALPEDGFDVVGKVTTEWSSEAFQVFLNNCWGGTSVQFGAALVKATNSTFKVKTSTDNNPGRSFRELAPGSTFTNCVWLLDIDAGASVALRMEVDDAGTLFNSVKLIGCHFEIDSPLDVTAAATSGFAFEGNNVISDDFTNLPLIEISECTFDPRLWQCIKAQRCGQFVLRDNVYSCQDVAIFYNNTSGNVTHLLIDGGDWLLASGFLEINDSFDNSAEIPATATHLAQNLEIKNVLIDEDDATISVTGSHAGSAFDFSNRIILADAAPAATTQPGIRGDRWRLKAPAASQINEWVATNTDGTGSDWAPVAAVGAVLT